MLRSPLFVIGHVMTVDIIGLVQKMVGGIQAASWTIAAIIFTPRYELVEIHGA